MGGLQRWEEAGEIACGLWLIVSPFIFGYAEAGALSYWHFVLGAAIVVLLAVLELWQNWKLSDEQAALRRGRSQSLAVDLDLDQGRSSTGSACS